MIFAPDSPASAPGVLLEVNMAPTKRGYAAAPSWQDAGYADLAAASNGAALVNKLGGTRRLFAGTTTALYEGSGGTWTDRSRGTAYSTGAVRWQFAQYGDLTYATNISTQLQVSSTAAFADVANAPKAACMDTASGFLMLGNCDDTSTGLSTSYGLQEHRWWCSQLFNPSGTWAPDITTQATSGLLVSSPGPIVAVKALGDQIVYYKSQAMHVGSYVGTPEVWRFERVPVAAGAVSSEAVVAVNNVHYFIGQDDIWRFDGSRPVPISDDIREWFFGEEVNSAYLYLIAGQHDPTTSTIWWWYPSGTDIKLTAALVYNYQSNKWGRVDLALTAPLYVVRSAVTYDSLGSEYYTYDDLPEIAYDSPFWNSGKEQVGGFVSTTLYTLTGTPGASSFITGWVGDADRWSLADRVRLRYRTKPTSQTLEARALDELGATLTSKSCTHNVDRFDLLQNARWHQLKATFTGPVEVEDIAARFKPTGYE
jgi:hypothetical protein